MTFLLIAAAALSFGMMVLHALSTILAYLAAFAIIGLVGWWIFKARRGTPA